MTDPNTPITPNPQDLIDQALGGASATTTPTPTPTDVTKPATAEPTPTLPVPEPLTTPTPETTLTPEPTALPVAESAMPEVTDSIPTVEPAAMPEPPSETKPMGEDMPLAFVGGAALDGATTQQPVSNITTEPITPASVPPILTGTSNGGAGFSNKPKKNNLRILGMFIGFLALFGVVGYASYYYYMNNYGENATIAEAADKTEYTCGGCQDGNQLKWKNGKCVQINKPCGGGQEGGATSTGNESECKGCREGYEVEWNGTACIKRRLCNVEENTSQSSCEADGGSWCSSVDATGKAYGFCGKTSTTKNCNTLAAEKGYVIQIGKVQCTQSPSGAWVPSAETVNSISGANTPNDTKQAQLQLAVDHCKNGGNFTGAGTESYICSPGTDLTSGCTELNGKKFTGTLGCFCGTVQVDTPNGHTSYSSTCGCEEEEETTTSNPSPSPSAPVAVSLMCTGLTRTPTTTPAVGDKVTFTCVGASTPVGAVSLTYKFRYSLNNGAYVAMTNKTATTSELTIAACGSYKVQCQTCGTINGVLTCDPNWVAATQ